MEFQPAIGLPTTSQDKHHGPIGGPEHTRQGLLVGQARFGGIPGMGMDPNPGKLIGPAPEIDLLVKKFGHRLVVERYRYAGASLLNEHQIGHKQRIRHTTDPEAADFGRTGITEIQQFAPGGGAESQQRLLGQRSLQIILPRQVGLHGIAYKGVR